MTQPMGMFDPSKYCPQCGSAQVKYQAPNNVLRGLIGLLLVAGMLIFPAFLLLQVLRLLPATTLMQLLFVLVLVFILLALVIGFFAIISADRTRIYRWKCQQCDHQWTITREEWLQSMNAPQQTKAISAQERQEKKAVVEKMINQIKKM